MNPVDSFVLRFLYFAVTALCIMMVIWILLLPGSWLIGRAKWHDDLVLQASFEGAVVPIEIMTKYQGHTLVHVTHILPGAVWAGIIPFQLHPDVRRRNPKIHRFLGYLFATSVILMSIGVGIILQRGLLFERFFPDLPPQPISTEPPLIFLTIWFLFTGVYAVSQAMQKRVLQHRRWILRHVSSGIWIAIQRFLLTTLYPILYTPPISRTSQRDIFVQAAIIGMCLSFILGEYAIIALDRNRTKSKNA